MDKVKVPKYYEDYLKERAEYLLDKNYFKYLFEADQDKKNNLAYSDLINGVDKIFRDSKIEHSPVNDWIKNNYSTAIDAIIHGYEIKDAESEVE